MKLINLKADKSKNESSDSRVVSEDHNVKRTRETFIENRSTAFDLICKHLSRFANNKDVILSRNNVLNLWVVRPSNDSEIPFVDAHFDEDLLIKLNQAGIEFIELIKKAAIPKSYIDHIIQFNGAETISEGRLYYKLSEGQRSKEDHNEAPSEQPYNIEDNSSLQAHLICIKGQEYLSGKTFLIDAEQKKEWNIGRGTHSVSNDIVINDDYRDISRRHAAVVWDDGEWYGRCREGSCRNLMDNADGPSTKIRRINSDIIEELGLHHRKKNPLKDGDVIILSKELELLFTLSPDSKK